MLFTSVFQKNSSRWRAFATRASRYKQLNIDQSLDSNIMTGRQAPGMDHQSFLLLTMPDRINNHIPYFFSGEQVNPIHYRTRHKVWTFGIIKFVLPRHISKLIDNCTRYKRALAGDEKKSPCIAARAGPHGPFLIRTRCKRALAGISHRFGHQLLL